jgi:hypothetical protein
VMDSEWVVEIEDAESRSFIHLDLGRVNGCISNFEHGPVFD